MAAPPDWMLDALRDDYVLGEEGEMPQYLTPSDEIVGWRCGKCNQALAIRARDMLWELMDSRALIRQGEVPIGIRCGCGYRNEWQGGGWGELRLRR